jgi:hypothetical protein
MHNYDVNDAIDALIVWERRERTRSSRQNNNSPEPDNEDSNSSQSHTSQTKENKGMSDFLKEIMYCWERL